MQLNKVILFGATIVIAIIAGKTGFSQDIHFSQFYEAPLQINPGLTGTFGGDHRVVLNYKDQWGSVTSGNAYRTYAFSYDGAIMKQKWDKGFLGVGLFLYNDKAGDSQLGTTKGNISLSSILSINKTQNVSVGLQGGFAQRGLSTTDLRWDNQFDGTKHNASLSSNETADYSSFGFGDIAAGATWNYHQGESNIVANDQFRANAGVAFFHVNRPKQKFSLLEDKLYSKVIAHAGALIGIQSTDLAIKPSFLYMRQGPNQEVSGGIMVRYRLKEESRVTGAFKETALSAGTYWRVGDAMIPAIMLEYASFGLGISYDVNISKLTQASGARGGMEIALRYVNPNPFKTGKGSKNSVRFL